MREPPQGTESVAAVTTPYTTIAACARAARPAPKRIRATGAPLRLMGRI